MKDKKVVQMLPNCKLPINKELEAIRKLAQKLKQIKMEEFEQEVKKEKTFNHQRESDKIMIFLEAQEIKQKATMKLNLMKQSKNQTK